MTLLETIVGEILPPVGFFFPLAFFLVLGDSLLIVSSTEFKVLMSLSRGDTFFFFVFRKALVVDGAKSESSTLDVYYRFSSFTGRVSVGLRPVSIFERT